MLAAPERLHNLPVTLLAPRADTDVNLIAAPIAPHFLLDDARRLRSVLAPAHSDFDAPQHVADNVVVHLYPVYW